MATTREIEDGIVNWGYYEIGQKPHLSLNPELSLEHVSDEDYKRFGYDPAMEPSLMYDSERKRYYAIWLYAEVEELDKDYTGPLMDAEPEPVEVAGQLKLV